MPPRMSPHDEPVITTRRHNRLSEEEGGPPAWAVNSKGGLTREARAELGAFRKAEQADQARQQGGESDRASAPRSRGRVGAGGRRSPLGGRRRPGAGTSYTPARYTLSSRGLDVAPARLSTDTAGFLVAVFVWAWVVLPALQYGPTGPRDVLRAKFFNKGPDGQALP